MAATSGVEAIKAASNGLRGTLAEELASPSARFSDAAAQLLKFHGSYQQDDRDVRRERDRAGRDREHVCMVRAGIPGGVLTAEQYLALDGLADALGDATLRVTTRQGLQYHFVRKGDLRPLIAAMNAHLVTTLAACGDVVRNVACCPAPPSSPAKARVQADAATLSRALKPSTSAYWQLWVDGERAASAQHDEEPDRLYGTTYLPRKFKVGFAFPADNCVDVFTHDVGIVPTVRAGRVSSYTVLAGGGLGMTHNNPATYPRLADVLGAVAPAQLVDVVTALVAFHRDHGDRDDRKHARLKYLLDEWGADAVRAEVERRAGVRFDAVEPLSWEATDDHLGWHAEAGGSWWLGVRVESGRIRDAGGVALRSALRSVVGRYATGVRFTPRQDVLLTGIAAGDRHAVVRELRDRGVPLVEDLPPVARHALACPALPTCGLALAEAERVLPRLVAGVHTELARVGLGDEPVHVRVTGCPNGCARPYSTEIGVVGRGKDHYAIFLGGDAQGTRLNRSYADRVPLDAVPAVLAPVFAAFAAERGGAERLGEYCARVGVDVLAERFRPDDAFRRRPQRALAARVR